MILRPYQRAAIDCTWQWMRQHDGNPAIVLPTGGGKSPVMGALAKEACQQWQARVAILAHTKELVRQNAEKLAQVWPEADLGIYSASLKRRDRFNQVLSCQIQSVAKRAGQLGRFNLILIDEAHRIPLKGEGMYLRFIAECRRFNPDLRVIGLTATPYRLQGAAVPVCGPDYILNEISYEARIGDLINDGYLSALVSKGGRARADLSGVHIRGGEYIESELARAVDKQELINAAADEVGDLAADRRALIVFCVSVEHAEHVQAALIERGITTGLVHGGTPAAERDAIIGEYQAGKLRALCNVNVLSEGFDAPHVDCVVMLRPTKSPGLYYQQVGRGLRLHPDKTDCLVLDFAGNAIEHGPVDEIRVSRPRERKPAEVQTGVSKECPKCLCLVPAATRRCPDCEHEWPEREIRHLMSATGAPILGAHVAPVTHAVDRVSYDEHLAKSGVLTLLVVYRCGLLSFREWICFEHEGFARRKAESWWAYRSREACPATVADVLAVAGVLRVPSAVCVKESGKYPEIVGYEFANEPERESASVERLAGFGDQTGSNAGHHPLPPMRALQERILRRVEGAGAG